MRIAGNFRVAREIPRSILRGRAGAGMITSLAIAAATMGVSLGAYFIANTFFMASMGSLNRGGAMRQNEIVMGRASHAVGVNAVLCRAPRNSSEKPLCRWNPDSTARPADFGFESGMTSYPDGSLEIVALACIPKEGEDIVNGECIKSRAKVSFSLIDIESLRSDKLVAGEFDTNDKDKWAVRIVSKVDYVGASTTGTTDKAVMTAQAIVRRPRMFISISADPGFCERACVLARNLGGFLPCTGPIGNVADTSERLKASATVRFQNLGPGYLHRVKVYRRFYPNPVYTAETYTSPGNEKQVWDSADTHPDGIAAGQTVTFTDTGLPCYDQEVNEAFVSPTATACTTTSTVLMDKHRSGRTEYFVERIPSANPVVVQEDVDPANIAQVSTLGSSIQGRTVASATYCPCTDGDTTPTCCPGGGKFPRCDPCELDPTLPGCPVIPDPPITCLTNPSLPECDPCLTNPMSCYPIIQYPQFTGDGGSDGGGCGL